MERKAAGWLGQSDGEQVFHRHLRIAVAVLQWIADSRFNWGIATVEGLS